MTNDKIKKLDAGYGDVLSSMVDLLEESRRTSARAVNSIMTATYWEIGRRIVQLEQGGEDRAEYGKELLKRLADDLTSRFGRGFSQRNLAYMRTFFVLWPILQTPSAKLESEISPTLSSKLQVITGEGLTTLAAIAETFPLPWSHYVKLLSVDDEKARKFYEEEALRGGWSVRQLDRQIGSKFYERTLLSKNKAAMIQKGMEPQPGDLVTPEEQIKDPFVLEFLDLRDEYSENDLEDALIHKLEDFLLELGSDFTFVGRQKRLRIGDEWYRIDLLFFHRKLRCLTSERLYQFKITLLESQPPIWRRIQVKDSTLDKFHERIQTAMGWTNSHLHQFEIDGERYGDLELLDDGFEDFECVDSTVTKISEIVPKDGKKLPALLQIHGGGHPHESQGRANAASGKDQITATPPPQAPQTYRVPPNAYTDTDSSA